MSKLAEYQHLWDGSEMGWKLKHINRMMWRMTICFSETGPTHSEIIRLRELLDEFRNQPMAEVWRLLRGCSLYTLERELGNIESRQLGEKAEGLGLSVNIEPIDRSGYLPMSADGSVLLIEDDDICDQVVQRMIAAGVPVEEVEVD